MLNFWPPFFFSGITVIEVAKDFRYAKVRLKKKMLTSNYVGTLFGGSLFAMTDPFYMVMVMKNLGSGYIVWDKKSEIDYVSPGKTTVYAEFNIWDTDLEEIKREVAELEASGAASETIYAKRKELLNSELQDLIARQAFLYDDAEAQKQISQDILDKQSALRALDLAEDQRVRDAKAAAAKQACARNAADPQTLLTGCRVTSVARGAFSTRVSTQAL
jgi:acyl-coenzyme A thioesterase PaaI-like protein